MLAALLLATLLSVTDPPGDAVGNGSLSTPTAAALRSTDVFDVRSLSVPRAPTFGFTLTFAAAPGAFPQPITDVYLHDAGAGPGATAPLLGSGMALPQGTDWHLAFRLTGAELRVFAPAAGGVREVSAELGARAAARGGAFTVTTELPLPRRFSLYGATGFYDPFTESGWRALRRAPSPWAFSSVDQQPPVLDVIADTPELQNRALVQGVLPEVRATFVQERWLWLSGAGVALALVGLAARFIPRAPAAPSGVAPSSAREAVRRISVIRAAEQVEVPTQPDQAPQPPGAATSHASRVKVYRGTAP